MMNKHAHGKRIITAMRIQKSGRPPRAKKPVTRRIGVGGAAMKSRIDAAAFGRGCANPPPRRSSALPRRRSLYPSRPPRDDLDLIGLDRSRRFFVLRRVT